MTSCTSSPSPAQGTGERLAVAYGPQHRDADGSYQNDGDAALVSGCVWDMQQSTAPSHVLRACCTLDCLAFSPKVHEFGKCFRLTSCHRMPTCWRPGSATDSCPSLTFARAPNPSIAASPSTRIGANNILPTTTTPYAGACSTRPCFIHSSFILHTHNIPITHPSYPSAAVCDVVWLQSKTGQELMTVSTDGSVLWWDTRNLAQPQESLQLKVVTVVQSLLRMCSAISCFLTRLLLSVAGVCHAA